jgi:uncharacterized phage protein (TIGR02218 family)
MKSQYQVVFSGTTLAAFLQSNNVFYRPDLFTITLASGLVINTTSHQMDLLVGSTTFFASKYGNWSRGAFTSTNDATQVDEMALTVACDQTVLFPGSNTPLLQTAESGLFDRARVSMATAYMLQNFNPNNVTPAPVSSNFVATKFVGDIVTSADPLTTTNATFKVSGLTYLLQEAWPQRVVQSGCTYALFDKNCALNKASYVQNKTIATGSSSLIINLNTALPNAAPYYDAGFITFTSGQNQGLSFSIAKQLSTTQLQLSSPVFLPITVGDAIGVYPGCAKDYVTCDTKFGNKLRFSGCRNVPEPERAVQL